jgi:hypothetical protein
MGNEHFDFLEHWHCFKTLSPQKNCSLTLASNEPLHFSSCSHQGGPLFNPRFFRMSCEREKSVIMIVI